MGATGNVGQGDYAVAYAFLDAFAHHRGTRVAAGERSGADPVGRLAAVVRRRHERGRGHAQDLATARLPAPGHGCGNRRVPPRSGQRRAHVVVWAGNRAAGVRVLQDEPPAPETARPAPRGPRGRAGRCERALRARTSEFLKAELCRLTQLPPDEIDDAEPLGSYGMDSILATELTAGLEDFRLAAETLLFEVPHARRARWLFPRRPPGRPGRHVRGCPGAGAGAGRGARDRPAPARAATAVPRPEGRADAPLTEDTALDIAVIGLSGRYPEARDVHEFWENLRAGRALRRRGPRGPLGLAGGVLRAGPHRARPPLQQVGRLHRRGGPLRPAVLQHRASRGGLPGPAGAAVPGTRLDGDGGRRVHPGAARGAPPATVPPGTGRRCTRASCGGSTSCCSPTRRTDAATPALGSSYASVAEPRLPSC
ncbi:phosphopantetheine-binding protein [Streptomyces thinghirensis]|nr:phosphopantetheine-binding protein [Streptomyces thinghirensis]